MVQAVQTKIKCCRVMRLHIAGSAATATLIVWISSFKFDPIAILVEDLYFRYFESARRRLKG